MSMMAEASLDGYSAMRALIKDPCHGNLGDYHGYIDLIGCEFCLMMLQ